MMYVIAYMCMYNEQLTKLNIYYIVKCLALWASGSNPTHLKAYHDIMDKLLV